LVLPYLAGNCEKKIIRAKRNRGRSWAPATVLGTFANQIYFIYFTRLFEGSRRLREGSMGQYERNSHAMPLVYGVRRMASAPMLRMVVNG